MEVRSPDGGIAALQARQDRNPGRLWRPCPRNPRNLASFWPKYPASSGATPAQSKSSVERGSKIYLWLQTRALEGAGAPMEIRICPCQNRDIDQYKKAPCWLRAQFDMSISPILNQQSTVKQMLCAILCDLVRPCAIFCVCMRGDVHALVEDGNAALAKHSAVADAG